MSLPQVRFRLVHRLLEVLLMRLVVVTWSRTWHLGVGTCPRLRFFVGKMSKQSDADICMYTGVYMHIYMYMCLCVSLCCLCGVVSCRLSRVVARCYLFVTRQ